MTASTTGRPALSVGIVGCGLIGRKRAAALGPTTSSSASFDVERRRCELARRRVRRDGVPGRSTSCSRSSADVVVVAVTHDQLAKTACKALVAGAHVLVEKPAGIGSSDVGRSRKLPQPPAGWSRSASTIASTRASRARSPTQAHPGGHGPIMHVRARYGHGGRLGYDREWRAQPARLGRRRAGRSGHAPARPQLLARWDRSRSTRRCSARTSGPSRSRTTRWSILGERGPRGAVGDAPRELDRVEEPVLARDLLPHGEAPGRRPRALVRPAAADRSTG